MRSRSATRETCSCRPSAWCARTSYFSVSAGTSRCRDGRTELSSPARSPDMGGGRPAGVPNMNDPQYAEDANFKRGAVRPIMVVVGLALAIGAVVFLVLGVKS